jgi:hypothetical protein
MCKEDGSGPEITAVRADACNTSSLPDYGGPKDSTSASCKNWLGCSGNKNCYGPANGACAGATPYCVSEPGLSCGAKPGTSPNGNPVSSGGTSSTPPGNGTPPSSTPPGTPPGQTIGPACVGISMSPTAPTFGTTVVYTCNKVAGNDIMYAFKVTLPDGTVKDLKATANVSESIKVDQYGTYKAVCGVCSKSNPSACFTNNPFQFN